jgi:hypothetical protein
MRPSRRASAVARPFSRLRRSCQATMIPEASPREQASTASPRPRSRQGFEPETFCSTTSAASSTPAASAQRRMSRRCSSIEIVRSLARLWRMYGISGRPLLFIVPPFCGSPLTDRRYDQGKSPQLRRRRPARASGASLRSLLHCAPRCRCAGSDGRLRRTDGARARQRRAHHDRFGRLMPAARSYS